MKRLLRRTFVLLSTLVIAVSGAGPLSVPQAHAFDVESGNPWQVGYMPETCFKGGGWTDNRRSEFNAAVQAWLDAVTNLGLLHHANPYFNCTLAYVQLHWVDTLGGPPAETASDGQDIWFASYDGAGQPIPWNNFSSTPPTNPYDMRAVSEHELGHAIGLKHPEANNSYPWKSWSPDDRPTMVASMPNDFYAPGRSLELDDIAGGYWMKSRQWVARPEMGANALGFWDSGNGNLTACNASWACLWNGPSNANYTLRFTVDGRSSRSTPSIAVTWERDTGAQGTMQLEIQYRSVGSNASGGQLGTWLSFSGPVCSAGTTSWSTCTWNANIAANEVDDIKLFIRNQTDGMIKIARVEATDG